MLLNNTKASFPKIDPRELFSELPFGGVLGSMKLNNPNNAEATAAKYFDLNSGAETYNKIYLSFKNK